MKKINMGIAGTIVGYIILSLVFFATLFELAPKEAIPHWTFVYIAVTVMFVGLFVYETGEW
jgi:membrane protein YdbS with pleckstrin-like domain